MAQSYIQALLSSDAEGYKLATQSSFLRNAAQGKVSKDTLGQWLANDRLYIHAYIRGIGRLLSFLSLPQTVARDGSQHHKEASSQLLAWAIDALVNIQREEEFFVNTAAKYGIDVNLPVGEDGVVSQDVKLEGLRRFEALFDGLQKGHDTILPWLECAVAFYGTEKCYLDAWTWAKSQLDSGKDGEDEDGGALRNEFIPNWTVPEFVAFVDRLGRLIDDAVTEQVRVGGQDVWKGLLERGNNEWSSLLVAEAAFWPIMN